MVLGERFVNHHSLFDDMTRYWVGRDAKNLDDFLLVIKRDILARHDNIVVMVVDAIPAHTEVEK